MENDNPDPKKQAQEEIFSWKINKIDHRPFYFDQNLVKAPSTHKHLGMILDTRLDLNLHLKNVQKKVMKLFKCQRSQCCRNYEVCTTNP